MKCPSCQAEVDFRRETCAGCGSAYLEAFEKRAAADLPRRERRHGERRQSDRPSRARAWAAGLLMAAAAVCLAGLVGARRPAPLPAGSLRHEAGGFAFMPPAGWTLASEPDGVRLARGPAALRVWRRQGRLPEEPAELARAAFNGATVRALSSARADLGGQEGLRVEVAGERVVLPSPEAGRQLSPLHAPAPAQESGELRGLVVALPRGETTLLVLAFSESGDFARRKPEIEAFVAGLRATR